MSNIPSAELFKELNPTGKSHMLPLLPTAEWGRVTVESGLPDELVRTRIRTSPPDEVASMLRAVTDPELLAAAVSAHSSRYVRLAVAGHGPVLLADTRVRLIRWALQHNEASSDELTALLDSATAQSVLDSVTRRDGVHTAVDVTRSNRSFLDAINRVVSADLMASGDRDLLLAYVTRSSSLCPLVATALAAVFTGQFPRLTPEELVTTSPYHAEIAAAVLGEFTSRAGALPHALVQLIVTVAPSVLYDHQRLLVDRPAAEMILANERYAATAVRSFAGAPAVAEVLASGAVPFTPETALAYINTRYRYERAATPEIRQRIVTRMVDLMTQEYSGAVVTALLRCEIELTTEQFTTLARLITNNIGDTSTAPTPVALASILSGRVERGTGLPADPLLLRRLLDVFPESTPQRATLTDALARIQVSPTAPWLTDWLRLIPLAKILRRSEMIPVIAQSLNDAAAHDPQRWSRAAALFNSWEASLPEFCEMIAALA